MQAMWRKQYHARAIIFVVLCLLGVFLVSSYPYLQNTFAGSAPAAGKPNLFVYGGVAVLVLCAAMVLAHVVMALCAGYVPQSWQKAFTMCRFVALGLCIAGTLAYLVYLQVVSGNVFVFLARFAGSYAKLANPV